ncbi:uncharacterized protein LOC106158809 isoform X2 [Lingula anatina]|nr:uncharacterized protein LOC106158809 isoform X2 [Lingula anatina]|eukprot:XP_013390366.1 uncharacterized protein LOC106158809 isoform X2 [Lingula anatina]
MGFEITDGQQAVQAGKLTVEEAVEWILQGKPQAAPALPGNSVLRLRPQQGSSLDTAPSAMASFVKPVPIPEHVTAPSAASQLGEEDKEEEQLASRMRMSDEQRKIKETFEEKQREEARKSALSEKKLKKKAHEQALKQIAEDRELQKQRKSGGPTSPRQQAVERDSQDTVLATSPLKPAPSTQDKCLLQIRLMNGRVLRHTFSPGATLSDVWDLVQEQGQNSITGMAFMQPFPRREFTREDLTRSLSELGLTPTGSLVLKKMETASEDTASSSSSDTAVNTQPDGATSLSPPPPPLLPLPAKVANKEAVGVATRSPVGHSWGGAGHRMDTEEEASGVQEQAEGPSPMDIVADAARETDDEEEEEMEEEGHDVVPGGGVLPGMLPPHPMFGGGGHHQWGEGQRLAGDVPVVPQLPAQLAKNAAAAAALQRIDQPQQPTQPVQLNQEEQSQSTHQSEPPSRQQARGAQVHTLLQQCTRHVSQRLCDPRVMSMTSPLGCLPTELAEKLLQYVLKERLLKPKTLNAFLPCHLRQLVFDFYPYTTNELLAAVRFHTSVVHVSLCSCTLITDKGLQPLVTLRKLKYLNLSCCGQITNGCFDVIKEFPLLVTLILEGTKVTDEGVQDYANSEPSELVNLNLNKTAVTHAIFSSLQKLQKLRSLNLDQTQVHSLSGLQSLQQIDSLSVAATGIGTDSLLVLSMLHNLSGLDISRTEHVEGDTALQYIAGLRLQSLNFPSRLSTTGAGMLHVAAMPLTSMDLTNYIYIQDRGLESIGKITSLRRLLLTNTNITDVGMMFLEGLTNLEVLYLDKNAISDEGAAVIKAFSRLQELSLSETRVSSDFLVAGILNRCLQLTKLNLSRTRVSDRGIKCLRLPHLALLNLDGTRVKMTTVLKLDGLPELKNASAKNLTAPGDSSDD